MLCFLPFSSPFPNIATDCRFYCLLGWVWRYNMCKNSVYGHMVKWDRRDKKNNSSLVPFFFFFFSLQLLFPAPVVGLGIHSALPQIGFPQKHRYILSSSPICTQIYRSTLPFSMVHEKIREKNIENSLFSYTHYYI